jgi:hypothetical protein
MYGKQDVSLSTSADGVSERVIDDKAELGRWVTSPFGSYRYIEGTEYAVQLVPEQDSHCFYEPADQARWVYDGPSSPSATVASPSGGGAYPQGSLGAHEFLLHGSLHGTDRIVHRLQRSHRRQR